MQLYVRPHELEIDPAPAYTGLRARILRITATGPVAKIQLLTLDDERLVNVELSLPRLAELDLKTGVLVSLVPRQAHGFLPTPRL
jgi:hypothetical protein